MTLRQAVLNYVTESQGCKATELAVGIAEHPDASDFNPGLIDELITNGDLVEVEYILPQMSYRAKSYLFPKGTHLKGIDYE